MTISARAGNAQIGSGSVLTPTSLRCKLVCMHTTDDSDGTPVDPAQMLGLLQEQRRTTQSRLVRSFTWVLVTWAAAWVIGFGTLWASTEGALGVVPAVVAWPVFGACIAGGIVVSIVAGVRSASSGVHGRSQIQGALYGWSWTIAMIGVWLLGWSVQRAGASAAVLEILYPALFTVTVGILYLSGGTLWRSLVFYILGIVMIVIAVVASFVGAPHHYLVYATGGPVAMLIVAALMARGVLPHEPRPRRQDAA